MRAIPPAFRFHSESKECVFFSVILCVRLCLRFLGELEIENKLKKSNATPIVFAHRVHTNNLFIFLALGVALAFEFEVRNSGR